MSDDERRAALRAGGMTDAEIDQADREMREEFERRGPAFPQTGAWAVSLFAKAGIIIPQSGPRSIADSFGHTSRAADAFYQPGKAVGESRDLHRVLELPRRAPLVVTRDGKRHCNPALNVIADELVARLGRPNDACECEKKFLRRCCKRPLPLQTWVLHEVPFAGGLLGPIGVGDGKTLLDLLVPMVMPDCKVAVLLVQPNLRDQLLEVDWEYYGQHWKLPNLAGRSTGRGGICYSDRPWLHVVAYSELSGAKSSDLLERIRPDLVICDEAQNVRRRDAARTKRFLRYFSAHPETRLCAWSGTLTKNSLKDYAHLSNLALKQGSPTPLHWPTVEEWAGAIDPSDFPSPIGELARFCEKNEHVLTGWQRRFVETFGVVSSPESGNCDASLVFHDRPVTVPTLVAGHLIDIARKKQRPDGEELPSAFAKAACLRQMACGFYYRWTWPRGESKQVQDRWLFARREWHREVREKLTHSREFMDSPLLCAKAAIRWYNGYVHIDEQGERHEIPPYTRNGPQPTWEAYSWPEWLEVRDTAKPDTEAVWVDDYLVRDAAAWAQVHRGIIWYEHDAFGKRVADVSGAPLYGAGDAASRAILGERAVRTIVASIRAHGTGKNLQAFSRNLVANPPSDGATWEQLVGRTHRQGQLADEVTVHVYRHTGGMREALDKARVLAGYIEGTMGGSQKLLRATFNFA